MASETSNDVFDNGLSGDHFIVASNANNVCNVNIKLPWGARTKFMKLENIELQGSVNSPLMCSITTDSLVKSLLFYLNLSRILYKYKGFLTIPPLALMDDILTVTKCGVNSLKMNALVTSKIETKRLELGPSNCFQFHFGNNILSGKAERRGGQDWAANSPDMSPLDFFLWPYLKVNLTPL